MITYFTQSCALSLKNWGLSDYATSHPYYLFTTPNVTDKI